MNASEITYIPLRRLEGLKNNPRKITQEGLNRLCDSIRLNGYWEHRPAAVEPIPGTDKYTVLDGNQRLKAMRRMKRNEMPCVIYTDLNEVERDELILRSNINNGEWNVALLQTEFEGIDFEDMGLHVELPDLADTAQSVMGTDKPTEEQSTEEPEEEEIPAERMAFWYRMMGDFLYPSDNEFEIPILLTDNQPVHLELPFTPWGVEGRYKKGISTYHFYVDDYRFERLYKDPILLLQSGCISVVEPNNSIHDQTPIAYGIYQIYRKRYLARYLQECGLQVWVDLNVSHRFMEYNLMGVPDGYNAFFTRGVTGWTPHLELCLEMAQRKSGKQQPNMYVYGGGKEIEQWCRDHGIRYLDEFMNIKRRERAQK